jgi:hypothetical protein
MAKTMVGVADGDEPLDPEIAARLRDFAALAAKSGLPELARLQASLDESIAALRPTLDTAALMPKFDTSALTAALRPKFDTSALTAALRPTIDTAALMPKFDTSALTAALMPKFDTAALMPKFDTSALTAALRPKFDTSALMPKFDTVALMPKLHFAIAAATQIDLSELVGFERVAEGLATSVSADALSALAASVEQAVPAARAPYAGRALALHVSRLATGRGAVLEHRGRLAQREHSPLRDSGCHSDQALWRDHGHTSPPVGHSESLDEATFARPSQRSKTPHLSRTPSHLW